MIRGDNRKIDGRRVIVDRELGRTKKSWYPRRLGGGKGESRRDRRDEELIYELKKQIITEKESSSTRTLDKKPGTVQETNGSLEESKGAPSG